MTASLQPGFVFDDRYRLDERIGEPGCGVLWRATDTILARNVSILVLPADGDATERVMTAARRASRIRDPRVVQVYDTAYDRTTAENLAEGAAYVVSEWVEGRTLTELLAGGPMHPERAGGLVGEAAEALAAAHQVAVAHLRLTPDSLVWTDAGAVKVTGVGIDAALTGTESENPGRTDAEGLGALLYAALTARWPGLGPDDAFDGLESAPLSGGAPITSPRQVRAGVPPELDATTDRALSQTPRRGRQPLATPAAVADALADYPDPNPLDFFGAGFGTPSGDTATVHPVADPGTPAPAGAPSGARPGRFRGRTRVEKRRGDATTTQPVPVVPAAATASPAPGTIPPAGDTGGDAAGSGGGQHAAPGFGLLAGANGGGSGGNGGSGGVRRPRTTRMLVAVPAGLLVVALLAAGGWRMATSGHGLAGGGPSPTSSASASTSETPVSRKSVPVVAAHDFDPDGDHTEHASDVRNAYDGTARTVWYTDRYNSADLGNLKPGVGIVFDLGAKKQIGSLDLRVAGSGGDVQLLTSDSDGSSVGDFTKVAEAKDTGEKVSLEPSQPVSARYWLVWFTKLPAGGGGYRAGVADTTFRPAG